MPIKQREESIPSLQWDVLGLAKSSASDSLAALAHLAPAHKTRRRFGAPERER